jgi:acetyl-CoA synthetase
MANILRNRNVKKGDRVTIYMPMIPEAAYAMLACARLGAIHSVVFGGFSPDSLANRIEDCKSNVVITADEGLRGGRKVPLKANTDAAIAKVGGVDHVIVVKRTGGKVDWDPVRDVWYHEAAAQVTSECPCEEMSAEDPLFILYTSGSTGKPKGVLHTTGGYLVYTSITHQYVFDYHEGDIYWCTADVGWVTGHSYIVYGPLSNGAITLMFEGRAELSGQLALLAGDRQAQGQHLLHRADCDPRPDAGRRGAGEEDLAQVAEAARLGRRADQPGSLGMVSPRGR